MAGRAEDCWRPAFGSERLMGCALLIFSDYDNRTLHAGRFLPPLRVAYAERVVESVRKRLRGTVRRTVEGSIVKLRVRY